MRAAMAAAGAKQTTGSPRFGRRRKLEKQERARGSALAAQQQQLALIVILFASCLLLGCQPGASQALQQTTTTSHNNNNNHNQSATTTAKPPNYIETGRQITGILDKFLTLGYDKRVRPNYGGPPVEVNVTMRILSISSVSEVMMDFTADFYFRQTWHDPRLSFKKLGDIQTLYVGAEVSKKIWLPDTFFGNEKLAYFHEATTPNVFLRIDHSGEVYRSIRLTVTSSCPMNLQYFPMDRQRCTIEAESYGYNVKDIIYRWARDTAVERDDQISLPQFDIVKTVQKYRLEELSSGTYSRLIAEIHFARRMGYYLIQIYIPSSLIVVISWVSFWLHRNASPARVQLGVTTVLTMTTLMSSTNAALPKISYVKSIDIFLGTCFIMVFAALLEYATVGYLGKRIAMRKAQMQHAHSQAQARIFAQLQAQGAQGNPAPPRPSTAMGGGCEQPGSPSLGAASGFVSGQTYWMDELAAMAAAAAAQPVVDDLGAVSMAAAAAAAAGQPPPTCRSQYRAAAPPQAPARHCSRLCNRNSWTSGGRSSGAAAIQCHAHHQTDCCCCPSMAAALSSSCKCSGSGRQHTGRGSGSGGRGATCRCHSCCDNCPAHIDHPAHYPHASTRTLPRNLTFAADDDAADCHHLHHYQFAAPEDKPERHPSQPATTTSNTPLSASLPPSYQGGGGGSSKSASAAAAAAAAAFINLHRKNKGLPPSTNPNFAQFAWMGQHNRNLETIFGIRPSDIDKYSRVVFPVCFVCFQLMYWIVYLHISAFLESEQQQPPH